MTKLLTLITFFLSISLYAHIDCSEYPDLPEVCGYNEITYENSCYATMQENGPVDVFHDQACGSNSQELGENCFTSIENECATGLYCKSTHHNEGVCEKECSDNGTVCGFNGNTYDSECDANNIGHTAVRYEGACGEQEINEYCLGDNDCNDGLHCNIIYSRRPCDPIYNEFNELTGCEQSGVCEADENECEFIDHEVTYCDNGLVCNYQNKCVVAECTETTQCDMNTGEICEDRQFKCQISSCTEDRHCASGGSDYICNRDTNICELRDNNGGDNGTGNRPGCTMSTTTTSNGYIFFLMIIAAFVVIRKKQILK